MRWSLILHGVLLLLVGAASLLPFFRKPKVVIPLDFTVVLDENLIEPNVPDKTDPQENQQDEDEPDDEPPPEPEKPVDLPPVPDAVPIKKPEEKKPPKPKPQEKPKPKPPEKKPPKPKPPKFVKGKRIEVPKKPEKPSVDFTKLKPVTNKPVTDRKLSAAEIARALQDGARVGTRNQIPENELSRCFLLVKNALYEAWEQPGLGDAGPRPTMLEIRLDASGRIASYRISQSSGSTYYDQTVLKAAAATQPIRGLSAAFLKQYETLTVEFRLQ